MARFAYYCSGHGFGHATRVIAVTEALLAGGHQVCIVTNAPERIFASVVLAGAEYRNAEIDAGISQPKAYDVDRRKTLDGLKSFLQQRTSKIATEQAWLKENHIQAVISDAPFLACAAASAAGIPSALITNFTFDSCYSYLSAPTAADQSNFAADDEPDQPLDRAELDPLVQQTIEDYSKASLLLRYPGTIPFPAFDTDVPMPAPSWVNREAKCFTQQVTDILDSSTSSSSASSKKHQIIDVPMISRLPSPSSSEPGFRQRFLASLGVPPEHQHPQTKILLVSFGGQNIPRPGSRPPSPGGCATPPHQDDRVLTAPRIKPPPPRRLATQEHLYLPGAPPALTHSTIHQHHHPDRCASPEQQLRRSISASNGLLAAPSTSGSLVPHDELLPPGWIALVCGLKAEEAADPLPVGFYGCPPDVYVPDLCTVCDALLGKLGYGTCSETISAHLPFIFVPRPMFVEEFGLKRLTEARNTLVEIDRGSFEAGQWAPFVDAAYQKDQERKAAGKVWEEAPGVDPGKVIVSHLEQWLASHSQQ